jgi:hypothetical protein
MLLRLTGELAGEKLLCDLITSRIHTNAANKQTCPELDRVRWEVELR